jgi:predicted nuclease with TOPRIM domain
MGKTMVDTKEAYLEKLQGKLDEWRAEIDRLKAKAAQSKADLKLQIDNRIKDLEAQSQEAQDKFQQLRQASGDAWEDLKGGVTRAWADLGEAVKSAIAKFT